MRSPRFRICARRRPARGRKTPTDAKVVRMRRVHLLWTAVGCGLLGVLVTVLVVARWGPLLAYDRSVALSWHASAVAHPAFTRLNQVLTDWVWDPWTMRTLATLAACWLLWRGRVRRAAFLLAATVLGSVLQQGMKAAI